MALDRYQEIVKDLFVNSTLSDKAELKKMGTTKRSVNNAGKEKAYKSFHILAGYLESKGITGIIYPCTRTKKIIGKNLVIFNRYDAVPIKDSIREIIYK